MNFFEHHKSAFPLSCIGFSVGPKFLAEMDEPRYRAIKNSKLTDSDDSEKSNNSFQTDEDVHEF